MEKNFEQQLKEMRERFVENLLEDDLVSKNQIETFRSLTAQEKEAKVKATLAFLGEKKAILSKKLLTADSHEKTSLKHHIEAINKKTELFNQKLLYIQMGKVDAAKKEKFKRQLAALELKRYKLLLAQKEEDCARIDKKIIHKKERFKKDFS